MREGAVGEDGTSFGGPVHFLVYDGQMKSSRVATNSQTEEDDLHHGEGEDEQHHSVKWEGNKCAH